MLCKTVTGEEKDQTSCLGIVSALLCGSQRKTDCFGCVFRPCLWHHSCWFMHIFVGWSTTLVQAESLNFWLDYHDILYRHLWYPDDESFLSSATNISKKEVIVFTYLTKYPNAYQRDWPKTWSRHSPQDVWCNYLGDFPSSAIIRSEFQFVQL